MKTSSIFTTPIEPSAFQLVVFGIGADGAMYSRMFGGGPLPLTNEWLSLGGGFDSAPVGFPKANQLAPWDTHLFCLGLNYEMFYGTASPGSVPPFATVAWQPLGGIFNGPPDSISFGPDELGKMAIVGLGTDNQAYLKIFDGGDTGQWLPSMAGWLPLGGVFIYEPVIAGWGRSETFDIFGVGTDRQMYHLAVDASHWPPQTSGWLRARGCFTSPPAVVKWSANRIDIFGVGMDKQMYHRAWENGGWIIDWETLGGAFDSPAVVVSRGENRLDIFGLGTDDQMYHKAWDGNQWLPSPTDWEPLGGVFNSAPTVISGFSGNRLDIFGLGTDDQMYHKAWDGNQWLPSPTDWEPLGGVFKIPRPTQIPSQLDFDWPITFPDGTAVGGDLRVTLFMDGTSRFSGHLHDSGADSYACSVGCAVVDDMNRAYTFEVFGHVWGALPGSRNFDWNVDAPASSVLRDNWSDVFTCGGAKFGARVNTQSFPPGGLIHNVSLVLEDLAGQAALTVIPLVSA